MSVDETQHEILRSLGRIEGRLDGIQQGVDKTNGRVTRLEEAVTTLKVSEGITTTKMTLISAGAGAVGAFILSLFKLSK